MQIFNIESFVARHITGRAESFFLEDMMQNKGVLKERIGGKSALVIGGAGTIGSSYIKALLEYEPSKVVVVDINENGLTELVRDCRSSSWLKVPDTFKLYPVSLGDTVFEKICKREGPFDIVANFSAHKHVRSEKDVYSVEAMIENNVFRAVRLLEWLEQNPPAHFFCVSTDKAANPVNVMGASKKLMEDLIMTFSGDFTVTTARFANVAFSNGSLLAGFLDRLMKNQPLACPSDVRRFFVSPKESGQICLMACMLGQTGEIFFPKLRENDMKRFSEVVEPFLAFFGKEPLYCSSEKEAREKTLEARGNQYPVYLFSSDTTGEKMYEEFYTEEEELDLQRFQSLGVIKTALRSDKASLLRQLSELQDLFRGDISKTEVVSMLTKLVPGFLHHETGHNLDHKM